MVFDLLRDYAYEFYEQLAPCAKVAVIGGIVIAFYIPYKYWTTRKRQTPIKNDYKQGYKYLIKLIDLMESMVYLYQFPRVKHIPSISPFCLKLETWLRMADIQYENVCSWTIRSLEGTLPFLEYNGKEYPDSTLAIRDMTAIFAKESMENHLNDEQKAIARAFEAMAENSLAMAVGYFRFAEHLDDLFQQLPKQAFGPLTPIFKILLKMRMTSKVCVS
uniref:Thioredoxin-like_fold domain-containing protein n=1 Tax=Elaeophora elaphi TaxID=1147741 RepID=A0A0R3RN14_9BILA